jgi:tetratricopeptide (TPR) repeat protein
LDEINFVYLVKKLDSLLNQGETAKVIEEAGCILKTESLSQEQIEEMHAFEAWAFYRQKEFKKSEEEALKAINTERGIRCLAAMANYLGNTEKAKIYLEKLPDSPGKANSRMIGLRNPKDTTSKEEVLALAYQWVGDIVDRINTANLMNNTARWLLAKGEGKEDLMLALGFMRSAIELYGIGTENIHHRASANFWVSQIMEKLFGPQAAIPAATESLTLWDLQLSRDSENSNFISSRKGAEDRLAQLTELTHNARININIEKSKNHCSTIISPIVSINCTQEVVVLAAYGSSQEEIFSITPFGVDVGTVEAPPFMETPLLLETYYQIKI